LISLFSVEKRGERRAIYPVDKKKRKAKGKGGASMPLLRMLKKKRNKERAASSSSAPKQREGGGRRKGGENMDLSHLRNKREKKGRRRGKTRPGRLFPWSEKEGCRRCSGSSKRRGRRKGKGAGSVIDFGKEGKKETGRRWPAL